MHSATKYLGGHSDVVMGALIVKDKDLADHGVAQSRFQNNFNTLGFFINFNKFCMCFSKN